MIRAFLILILALAAVPAVAAPPAAAPPDADAIVKRADEHLRGKTGYAELTMTLVRPDWSRELTMKSWSKGHRLSLVLITDPARDRGTAFLKRDSEVWNWVPRIERVVKIPPSMMSQSWMGSDFTNDDLVHEASFVVDYDHAVAGVDTVGGRACWKIRMTPKPDAAVVWGHVELWVSRQDDLEMQVKYYDEDGALVNTMAMSDVRTLGGRVIPTVMAMEPADKPGHKTVLTYRDAWFDQPLEDGFFSEQNMKRVR